MKKKILSFCVLVSTAFFIMFVGLYVYVLVAAPESYINSSGIHWPNITIKHSAPITVTNYPSKISANYPLYKPTIIYDPSIHLSVTKDWGGSLILFNQQVPCVGAMVLTMTGTNSNSVSEASEKGWDDGGIYFRLIEDVRQPDSWWTLRISLWYPIILFGILPAIFVVKKLRGRKSTSIKETVIKK